MHKLVLNPHSAHIPIRGTARAAWSQSHAYKRSNVWAQTERCKVSKGSQPNQREILRRSGAGESFSSALSSHAVVHLTKLLLAQLPGYQAVLCAHVAVDEIRVFVVDYD
jgi:hypothetical protein